MEQTKATVIEKDVLDLNFDGGSWDPANRLPSFDKVKTKEEWKTALHAIGWPHEPMFPFDVNRWGSCQYSTALSLFDLYFEIRKTQSQEETLEILGVRMIHDGQRKFEESHQLLIDHATERYKDWEPEEHIEEAKKVTNFDEMFTTMKGWASDLWCSAPMIAELAYKDFFISAPKSPGKGPCCNIGVQSDNYVTGLCCAFLKDDNIIKNEESFANFDT